MPERHNLPTAGLSVDPGCETLSCGPGERCDSGACVEACMGVVCPSGQLCQPGE